ncbi:DNA sulfur modification protein DndD [Streptomyces sp. MP131-18]|uniref:DNA sulfur modification protein DndD n=1 Tax=Streptomyces sp. MP131-18 TaxID=1857892 RepID=UPI00097C3CA3|nr:DNA sulfur modification protein DndD [Streptomyces sp. MP131-18]ONK12582.1 chromosome segregation protein [Streptomyces sp. MP131-18]
MLLHNITLEDFGAYRGTQTLDLTTQPGKPVVLVGGLNGCGKTTLLDAIQLALYGPRARCSSRGNRSYEAFLRESINRQTDPKRGAAITLEFSITVEGEERLYTLIRSWSASGKTLHEYVNVKVDGKFQKATSEGWADHVEDLLPLEIGSLFFFDGEKVESLADPDRASAVIESAVRSLLGVNTAEQLRTDLLALQRRTKITEADQQALARIGELKEQINSIEQEVDSANDRVGKIRSEVDRAKLRLEKAEHDFEKDGGVLYHRRAELEQRRDQVTKQLGTTEEALINLAAGALPLRLAGDQIGALRKQAAIEDEANTAAQVLDVLTRRDRQLLDQVGQNLSEGERQRLIKHLQADRRDREVASQTERVLNLSPEGAAQLAAIDSIIALEQRRAEELLQQAAEQAVTVEDVERQLAGVPEAELIASRLEERDEARDALRTSQANLERAVEGYEASKNRRTGLQQQLERAHDERVKSLVRVEETERIIDHCDRQRAVLAKFKDLLLQRRIAKLEVAVLQSFSQLMRKNGLVKNLNIDTQKFQFTLVGADGEPLDPGRLSAGERQLLAISLLWGLARVAGNRLPSVIDTPLGRLDSGHREHLVDRYFPKASHQVLLLSTDEEIDEELLQRLEPSIARTYTLVHDDATFTTSVEPGYWWTSGAAHVA